MKFNIAIDGPSAAGKSTIADLIAKKYNLVKLDTGAMYRIVGYLVLINKIDVNNEDAVLKVFDSMDLTVDKEGQMILNGKLVQDEIRNNEVAMLASSASKHLEVRARLVALQQKIAKNLGYILEGRDIGTVVLPDALVKIFLEANNEVRAKRRYDEYVLKGQDVNYQDILEDLEARDYQDRNREHSPLKQADDATLVDVSYLTIDEVVEQISKIVDAKIGDVKW